MPVAGAEGAVATVGDLEQVRVSIAPAVDSAGAVQGAGAVAAGVEGDVAVCRGGCGGLGEGQEGKEQGGDREGDQEGFTPPPPPIGCAPPRCGGRGGWWSRSRQRVSRLPLYTSAPPPSYPRPAAGISLGSASKPLPRRHPAPARPCPRRHSCAGRNPRSRPRLLLALKVLRRRGSSVGRAVGRRRRIRALVVAWVPACAGMTERAQE